MEPKNLIKPTCSSSSSSFSTKSIFKDNNGRSCTSFMESVSSNEFVDKKSGGLRLKEESTYCRRDKYDNKNEEFVHEYETKLKFTHLSYPNNQQHLNYYNAHHDDGHDDDDDDDDIDDDIDDDDDDDDDLDDDDDDDDDIDDDGHDDDGHDDDDDLDEDEDDDDDLEEDGDNEGFDDDDDGDDDDYNDDGDYDDD
ncbi:hypothetical protein CsatB_015833 [Cannabis sativa]